MYNLEYQHILINNIPMISFPYLVSRECMSPSTAKTPFSVRIATSIDIQRFDFLI